MGTDELVSIEWVSVGDSYGKNRLVGDDGDNRLVGGTELSSYPSVVIGGAGDDELYASSGSADRILGGRGNDTIVFMGYTPYGQEGGAGYGGPGADVLTGGIHGDVLDGGPGRDEISGAEGDDQLDGGGGKDRGSGGDGDDLCVRIERPTDCER